MNAVRRFLPSTRLLLVVGIPGIALIIAGFILTRPTKPTTADTGTLLALGEQRKEVPTVDSDNDGLPDWQEALIGTNPHNPDTDGDGTPDGVEVASGRDPLKKGPNDLIQKETITENTTPSAPQTYTPLTKTGSLSRNLMDQLVTLQNSGVSLDDPANIKTIANSIAGNFTPDTQSAIYGTTDITITQNADASSLRVYGNAMASLLSQLGVATASVGQGTGSEFQKMTQLATLYITATKNIVSVPVPKLFVTPHLALLNNIALLGQNMEAIAGTEKDAVAGIAALQRQGDLMTSFPATVQNLQSAIRADVVFNQNDIGYAYWFKGNIPTQ